MDNKGYIFSTDAVLALVVFFVIAGSLLTYYTLPSYLGADHQHLEAEADDALATLNSDGTLTAAMLKINSGDDAQKAEGIKLLKDKLNLILPSDTAYDLKINEVSEGISDDKGILVSNNKASRYIVLSSPAEGWLGRAWFKLEEVDFVEQKINITQTLWNFHNYLGNFLPWSQSYKFNSSTYWGITKYGGNKVNIGFSVPPDAKLENAYFLMGCRSGIPMGKFSSNYNEAYYGITHNFTGLNQSWAADVTFNNINTYKVPNSTKPNSAFKQILVTADEKQYPTYNAKVNISINDLRNGLNNFYVKFSDTDPKLKSWYNGASGNYNYYSAYSYPNTYAYYFANYYNMPWFAILADYETSILIPEGINTDKIMFGNCAGAALPAKASNGDTLNYYITYDLDTGVSVKHTPTRAVNFKNYIGKDSTLANGIPFVLDKGDAGNGYAIDDPGSAVAVVQEIDLTTKNPKITDDNVKIMDAYTVINAYGATDEILVEVNNGDGWKTIFFSPLKQKDVSYTNLNDGYGNTPGTLEIKPYLKSGVVNKVRVTVWDDVASTDYDFVGIVDSYSVVSYTKMPIKWENFAFDNYQSNVVGNKSNSYSQTKSFVVGTNPDCEKVLFFFGLGADTTHVKLEAISGSNTEVLYDSDTIPFALDIGALDASNKQLFTIPRGGENYTAKPGTYQIKLTAYVKEAWKSGDKWSGNSNQYPENASAAVEVYSGSRIAVVYPKFLANEWSSAYASTPGAAKAKAIESLIQSLQTSGFSVDSSQIQTEALYTGDMPNTIPIRLDLWRS